LVFGQHAKLCGSEELGIAQLVAVADINPAVCSATDLGLSDSQLLQMPQKP
jgi:hypothetical protein